jgi:hypothetical protein
MVSLASKILRLISYLAVSPLVLGVFLACIIKARFTKRDFSKPRFVFGSTPVISFSHWSNLLKNCGYESTSFVKTVYPINNSWDWDVIQKHKKGYFANLISTIFLFAKSLSKFDVFVMSCDGFLIGQTRLWRLQSYLISYAGCKSVVFTYGGDSYVYSKIESTLTLNALLLSYPKAARNQERISKSVNYWVQKADIFIPGSMGLDGFGRWDFPTPSPFQIDLNIWKTGIRESLNDGWNGPVVVAHAPNHRGFKGTELIAETISELQNEGLNIEFLPLEGLLNSEIREILSTRVDILVEQILFSGYALNAIEGMALGLPVISNLENSELLEYLRVWSFLSKCPIISANYNNLKSRIRELVTNPELRKKIGLESRKYAENFHGEEACKFMFESIIAKLRDDSFDLMNIYNSSRFTPRTVNP